MYYGVCMIEIKILIIYLSERDSKRAHQPVKGPGYQTQKASMDTQNCPALSTWVSMDAKNRWTLDKSSSAQQISKSNLRRLPWFAPRLFPCRFCTEFSNSSRRLHKFSIKDNSTELT